MTSAWPSALAGAFPRRAFLAVLAASLVAGCTSLGEERVEVHLSSVTLQEATPLEQRVGLGLRFQNRGATDLTVDGLAFRVEASGTTIASGVSSQVFTIPRFGEARVNVEATSTLAGVVLQVLDLQRQSGLADVRLRYRLYGTANLVPQVFTTGRAGSFGFDTVNEFPLPALPPLR